MDLSFYFMTILFIITYNLTRKKQVMGLKKVWSSVFILILLLFIAFEILTESKTIMESVIFSFQIWQNNIFPSLFPFFVLSEILIYYGFIEFISELFRPFMAKLFCMNGAASFVFFMSLVSGFPSNAKYTRELYQKGLLDEEEASKILTFSHFSNPLFILGTVSLTFLKNKEVGLLILFVHYMTNIIIGILFRGYHKSKVKKEKISLNRAIYAMHQKRMLNEKTFGQMIAGALSNSIQTLLLILGTVTMFLVLTTIIDHNLNLNALYQSTLNGFVEMTQGLKYVSLLNIPLKIKSVLTVMILSFGGCSVHMQVISILSDTKIKYLPFFTARVLHSALAGILVFSLFDLWTKFI